jgi:hypothetical protein
VFLCFICLRPVSCLPKVTSVSGLSILYCLSNVYLIKLSVNHKDRKYKSQA